MPRGVPANGQRRRRSAAGPLASAAQEASAFLAAGTENVPAGDLAPADLETGPADLPAEELIHDHLAIPDDEVFAVPEPEPVLTAEQERIKQLELQLAQLAGKRDVEPEIEPIATPGDDGNI